MFDQKPVAPKAARRYHSYRQFVYRQLERYDGRARSLALRSRRPKTSPTAHREEELCLIRRMLKRNGVYGLAEVYVRCQSKGYTRSFESMCRQIWKKGYPKTKGHRNNYTHHESLDRKFPGNKVKIEINMFRKKASAFQAMNYSTIR